MRGAYVAPPIPYSSQIPRLHFCNTPHQQPVDILTNFGHAFLAAPATISSSCLIFITSVLSYTHALIDAAHAPDHHGSAQRIVLMHRAPQSVCSRVSFNSCHFSTSFARGCRTSEQRLGRLYLSQIISQSSFLDTLCSCPSRTILNLLLLSPLLHQIASIEPSSSEPAASAYRSAKNVIQAPHSKKSDAAFMTIRISSRIAAQMGVSSAIPNLFLVNPSLHDNAEASRKTATEAGGASFADTDIAGDMGTLDEIYAKQEFALTTSASRRGRVYYERGTLDTVIQHVATDDLVIPQKMARIVSSFVSDEGDNEGNNHPDLTQHAYAQSLLLPKSRMFRLPHSRAVLPVEPSILFTDLLPSLTGTFGSCASSTRGVPDPVSVGTPNISLHDLVATRKPEQASEKDATSRHNYNTGHSAGDIRPSQRTQSTADSLPVDAISRPNVPILPSSDTQLSGTDGAENNASRATLRCPVSMTAQEPGHRDGFRLSVLDRDGELSVVVVPGMPWSPPIPAN
ncbi:hypothetical protein NM688_g3847 [Phlebia brevispora]|uniref:Uncharacterized protein n=1 Tax=Phlebia brevispora TaxID=194682 RepID=A0ACC1T4J3_9APHY|nr:hypothetical protein NM688_g3847 [Phlebia brevispora]